MHPTGQYPEKYWDLNPLSGIDLVADVDVEFAYEQKWGCYWRASTCRSLFAFRWRVWGSNVPIDCTSRSVLSRKCAPFFHHFFLLVDTIRVRIQTYPSNKTLPKKLGGLVGKPLLPNLYAGLPVALGFSIPALALYLTTYDSKCYLASAVKYNLRFSNSGQIYHFQTVVWCRCWTEADFVGQTSPCVSYVWINGWNGFWSYLDPNGCG